MLNRIDTLTSPTFDDGVIVSLRRLLDLPVQNIIIHAPNHIRRFPDSQSTRLDSNLRKGTDKQELEGSDFSHKHTPCIDYLQENPFHLISALFTRSAFISLPTSGRPQTCFSFPASGLPVRVTFFQSPFQKHFRSPIIFAPGPHSKARKFSAHPSAVSILSTLSILSFRFLYLPQGLFRCPPFFRLAGFCLPTTNTCQKSHVHTLINVHFLSPGFGHKFFFFVYTSFLARDFPVDIHSKDAAAVVVSIALLFFSLPFSFLRKFYSLTLFFFVKSLLYLFYQKVSFLSPTRMMMIILYTRARFLLTSSIDQPIAPQSPSQIPSTQSV